MLAIFFSTLTTHRAARLRSALILRHSHKLWRGFLLLLLLHLAAMLGACDGSADAPHQRMLPATDIDLRPAPDPSTARTATGILALPAGVVPTPKEIAAVKPGDDPDFKTILGPAPSPVVPDPLTWPKHWRDLFAKEGGSPAAFTARHPEMGGL